MDWQSLLGDIMRYPGYNQARIAREVGVSNTTIMRIRTGKTKEPTYTVGSKLVSLYLMLQHKQQ